MNRDNGSRVAGGQRSLWWRVAVFLLLLGSASAASAQDCSDYPNGVIDGFAGDVAPSQLQIDRNCTIRNFPADNPLRTNFSFLTQPGQTDERWLIIFDNVVHTGQMACNAVAGHHIWFTNGSSTSIQEGCQNLLIPVEKIEKLNPAGQTTASIGVPFTYRLIMPVLFDPATGTVINTAGSVNTLHGVTMTDDLNETGVDLTYLSHTAYWLNSGQPVAHTFTNVGGVLTFDNFPIIPAGEQIVVELTVVLEDSPLNTIGTQFINTAKWEFGRLIDGVFYQPLPGEWGISDPLTIAGPDLTVTKTGPATLGRTLNLGEWGDFAIDVQNTGLSEAWDITLVDELPDGPTGGMCNVTPEITSAQVFQSDGTTPVPGKGPLTEGVDYSISYTGTPQCELTINLQSPDAVIGPGERLIIAYRTQLDADSQDGATLTNVVGATRWFNDEASNSERVEFTRTITDGTPGVLDHEDAHTVTVALFGYFFEKTVENLTTGVYPATTAAPGDVLRYSLRLQTTDGALDDVRFLDDLGSLNASARYVAGSLSLVPGTVPAGADTSATNPNGGSNGDGLIDIRNIDVPAASEITIQFDITLLSSLIDGTVVTNQSGLFSTVQQLADSDDPFVNGQSDPNIQGDEDPTQLIIEAEPPTPLGKANTQATATIGEEFDYRITIPTVPHPSDLYDVRILDDLAASAADLEFVDVVRVSGSGNWTPSNSGTSTSLLIAANGGGIDIPAGEQVVIDLRVRLLDTSTNVAGLSFVNTASYLYNLINGDAGTERVGDAGTTEPMTIVEPELTLEKTGPVQMPAGGSGTFTLNVHNSGTSPAYTLTIGDLLANQPEGNQCETPPANVTAQVFEADGTTAAGPVLVEGSDFSATFAPDPTCTLTIELLGDTAVGVDERLLVNYDAWLDANAQQGALLTNVAGATSWFGVAPADINDQSRTYQRVITDGTVGTLDHEDAHTVGVNTPVVRFEKTVANLTSGDDPAATATPGDRLLYRLYVENVGAAPIDDFQISDELDTLNANAAFAPGTLTVVTLPAGADDSNTDANGGAAGTGLLDVTGLSLPNTGDTVLVEFEVELAGVIPNASIVYNQSTLLIDDQPLAISDDPNVNGAADPLVAGDEDPTQIAIVSEPAFLVQKISSYLDGDPNVLLAGESLRYTITVQNIGTDHATNVMLADQLPANTTYVAGSTLLNGVAVADGAGGTLPLVDGILINAPEDPTPGNMNAGVADNTATLTFDVTVYPDVPDGTIISNQAFVSAVDQGVAEQPSDDPRTEVPDDPTRDVVGNFPLLFAPKTAVLQDDQSSPGIVDPGDTLRYTITVFNNGTVAATLATLTDQVPANTIYVADSTTLNGEPVGQPDGGVFPLAAGIDISSSDLTPPLPGAGEGVLNPGESAVVQFDLLVDSSAVPGTLITNQAQVGTAENGTTLTDGDGNPATGPEPTVVVVGDIQQLSIAKDVAVVNGGPALPGAELEYTVTVRNVGTVPALYVELYDDLDVPVAGYLTYVDQSATVNGLTNGVVVNGNLITVDYFTEYGPLEPDETIVLRFRAMLDPNLAVGTTVTNIAQVYWDDPQRLAEASVSIDVGATPEAGMLSGNVWHDADHDDTPDVAEQPLEGWNVELLRDGQPIRTTQSDVDGNYLFTNVAPNYLSGEIYALRFAAADAGPATALLGQTDSDFTDGQQLIDEIVVTPGSNLLALNMPVDPNGVIYDSISRQPIAGATVTLVDARNGQPLPSACFDDPNHQDQVTVSNGYYKFDINFADPACPAANNYLIVATAPDTSYVPGPSQFIPPSSDPSGLPFDVPACPGSGTDAVLATAAHCEAQVSEFAPAATVPAGSPGTAYYPYVRLDDSQVPGSSQLFNNHIPLDPRLGGAVAVTKTTPMLNVTRGQLVPYIITVSNSFGADLTDVNVVDRFPAGFRYVEGSARFDGVASEPAVVGRELVWSGLTLATDGRHEIRLLLAVGAGVTEGEFVNRAAAVHAVSGSQLSDEATATVRIVPDPTFDCTDVSGKVYDDANRNGQQDLDENGLGGVRLVTARGLAATTDQHGRYHISCATVPDAARGSNFVLKLDDRSLPSGYRVSTRPVQVQRATRGKALKINFGASIHRVVGLDVADPVFEPGTTDMRPQWRSRIDLLLGELQRAPAVLRLAYVGDLEDESLVAQRVEVLKTDIAAAWAELNCCYELVIETEVFWRRGAPVKPAREVRQ